MTVDRSAYFAAMMADYIVRFRLSADTTNLQVQRVPIADLNNAWDDSWTTIVSYGGGFGDSCHIAPSRSPQH